MANIYRPPCDVGLIAARPADRPCTASERFWVLAATILGSSMAFIDGTVVNVALPVIQSELGTGVAGAQWVMEAYSLVLAALILVGGSLGDRFGRRRLFAAGIIIFAAASAACGAGHWPVVRLHVVGFSRWPSPWRLADQRRLVALRLLPECPHCCADAAADAARPREPRPERT